ncbi:MAG: dihydropteroate synthase [Chlorobium sp.]|jgi:dihydropteroate synthase|uniref:dihydropteroate synthase n=1 Tax=Chlorobium sp. TaxID=1095 RepID=UPI001DD2DBD4|nr:dihydropteroate synthase [Chlorobium sp.]MBN1279687.1 dihydropteroate synthase [Chlorobiaceae bacterium]MCF8216471.1 dihydropteroate synthase [Chlorobium sp.]MCF8271363.1 dihydropteroate synthase [Chlorobium sp.]MCF8287748.1 dihydropteroate synthase [Chlorobium sp.]MCF8291274.1 dihydropteroate synthase [Chlorobium sp.]
MKQFFPEHYRLECRNRSLDLSKRPAIMGILNLTPDSFSDGGRFENQEKETDIDSAVEHALRMKAEGASIIDIGGESTRPGSEKITARTEILRTVPVISKLRKESNVLISIDTYKAEVAEAALKAGAQIVNDISGFTFDDLLPDICRKYQAAVVLMHTPVTPQTMKWSTETANAGTDITVTIHKFLRQAILRAQNAGVHNILIDPGFGFGKSVEENFRILENLSYLLDLGYPLLCGLSKKSFLGYAIKNGEEPDIPPGERHDATTAAQTIALLNGASVIRAHDVKAAAHAISIVESMKKSLIKRH